LISLKSLLPCHTVAERRTHFEDRVRERGFNVELIPQMWAGTHWRPGDFGRWLVEWPVEEEDLLWSLTVDFDSNDRPIFITICDRSLKALANELYRTNFTSVYGSTALGGD
jgi:hypothetical protein